MDRIRRYLVIGASSETGRAFLQLLEKEASTWQNPEKITVWAHYRSRKQELLRLKEECSHLDMKLISCDLSDPAQTEELAVSLSKEKAFQGFLYLPAERMRYEKLKKMDLERLDRDYQIQIRSLARISREVIPAMGKAGFGKAVVLLSECTLGMPPRFLAEYTAVKYGALGLMRSLALEYADKNVTVNGLSPAMMETGFLADIDSRLVEMNAQNSVKKRNATVEEAAQAIAFLLSAASDYMNGVNLNLSGGNQV